MTGIERLRARAAIYACDGWEGDANILKDIADQIERETLPRPLFEDGELVQFGDEILKAGNSAKVDAFVVNPDGSTLIIAGMYRVAVEAGERVKRPAPKVLDADGVPVEVGDEVWSTNDSGLVDHPFGFIVTEVEPHLIHGEGIGVLPSQVSHRRPEPPDTWERLTAEVEACDGSACQYFKKDHDPKNHSCEGCKAAESGKDCLVLAVDDVLRRAKRLAGIEEE